MRLTCLRGIARNAFLLVMTSAISACAGFIESVFAQQNRTAAALATMTIEAETQNPIRLERIDAAEAQLQEACAPLRHVADSLPESAHASD
jgi:hypothetical protein